MSIYEKLSHRVFYEDENEEFLRRVSKNLISLYRRLIQNQFYFLSLKISIGLIFFTFPFLFFIYKFYSVFDLLTNITNSNYFNNLRNGIKIYNSVLWIIISLIFLIIFTLSLLFWKIVDLLQNPNLKYWNVSLIGYFIQYLIFFSCFINFSIDLYSNLLDFEYAIIDLVKKYSSTINFIDNLFILTNSIDNLEVIISTLSDKLIGNLNSILLYSIFYSIRTCLFQTQNFIFYILININFISLYITINYSTIADSSKIDFTFFFLIIIFSSYFVLKLNKVIKVYVNEECNLHRPKYFWKKIFLIFEIIKLIGTSLIVNSIIIYFLNDKFNLELIEKICNNFGQGLIILAIGSTLSFGELILDFIFYGTRKEFFLYKNKKYEAFIKQVKYIK